MWTVTSPECPGRTGVASLLCSKLAFTVLAAAMLALGTQAAHAAYVFQNIINNNDPTFNQELGINSAGTIAGYFGSGAAGHPNKGYTVAPPYGQANFTNENFPGSVQTQVTAINNAGVTVGFWSNSNLGVGMDSNFGFTDVGGTFTNVNNPNTPTTTPSFNQLLGVNNSNTAVGFYTDAAGVNHGYTYTIASNTFSANINDPNAGTATGQGTTAAAINNSGEIAGFYVNAAGNTLGFTDNNGSFTTIDPAGSTMAELLGVNDNGLAVGIYTDSTGVMHGLLYNLLTNTFLNVDDPSGIGTTTINGINDNNQLVGFYVDSAGNTVGLLANPTTTIPAPASLTLFAAGLLGLTLVRRRRKV
jgi:hypothetical protein